MTYSTPLLIVDHTFLSDVYREDFEGNNEAKKLNDYLIFKATEKGSSKRIVITSKEVFDKVSKKLDSKAKQNFWRAILGYLDVSCLTEEKPNIQYKESIIILALTNSMNRPTILVTSNPKRKVEQIKGYLNKFSNFVGNIDKLRFEVMSPEEVLDYLKDTDLDIITLISSF